MVKLISVIPLGRPQHHLLPGCAKERGVNIVDRRLARRSRFSPVQSASRSQPYLRFLGYVERRIHVNERRDAGMAMLDA